MITSNKLSQFVERCEKRTEPITAELFLTDYCNLKCGYCRYGHKSGRYMTFEHFVMFAEKLVRMGVRSLILTGGGEPLLNPHFDKITTWLDRNNIRYGVNTNLTKPIYANADYVKVSIDTGNEERYKMLRGKDKLREVMGNLRDTIVYKARTGNKTRIGVQCVASGTIEDVLSFYKAVKDYDVDYIYIRPLESVRGDGLDVSEIKNILPKNDERIVYSFKFGLKDYAAPYCMANWAVITIDVNGDVPYCCHRPSEIVGNILDLDIMERKNRYKVDMRSCERPCRLSGANLYLDELKRDNDADFI